MRSCTVCTGWKEAMRMLFSELYSVYYNTVAKIIETAFDPSVTEQKLQK